MSRGTILSLGHDLRLMTKRHKILQEAHFSVVSAVNPRDALKLLDAQKFDVLIVGCIDEREFCRMEEAAVKHGTPVLWLCCQPDGVRMSCQDAVITPAALFAKVEALLRPVVKEQCRRGDSSQVPARKHPHNLLRM